MIQISLNLVKNEDENLFGWDCLYSQKGGKVRYDSSHPNPCYCEYDDKTVGRLSGTFAIQNKANPNLACNNDINAFQFLDGTRDCSHSRGPVCSQSDPCMPCELSKALDFGDKWSRCRSCLHPDEKQCHFVHGIGPYCYKSSTSKEIVPCAECCTDIEPYFDDNGICI